MPLITCTMVQGRRWWTDREQATDIQTTTKNLFHPVISWHPNSRTTHLFQKQLEEFDRVFEPQSSPWARSKVEEASRLLSGGRRATVNHRSAGWRSKMDNNRKKNAAARRWGEVGWARSRVAVTISYNSTGMKQWCCSHMESGKWWRRMVQH